MSRRSTSICGLQRAGLIVFALLVALMGQSATAEELFVFKDEASVRDTMAALNRDLAYDAALPEPCRLHILNDLRGQAVFDDETFQSMHQALATSILGADHVDGCTVSDHEVGQNDVINFLEQRREAGDAGLALSLTYYQLGGGITMLASLRAANGDLLGSSGRFDLPVMAMANAEGLSQADVSGTSATEAKEKPLPLATPDRRPSDEPTPVIEKNVVDETTQQATAEAVLPEAVLRRELAVEARVAEAPSSPFNLRRIEDGIPSSIKTMRVVDAGGQDTALMANLADSFIDTTNSSKNSVDDIDIEVADAGAAFQLFLDNKADIVVTRQPISEASAARFANAYGVNMRSRYAEHVVAIADNRTGSLDSGTQSLECGISYPRNEMLMSTEDNPTSERVYLYTNPSIPNSMRDQFIDFALTTEGQAVVAEHAVDLRLQLSGADYAAWRYQVTGEQEAELFDVLERFRGLIRTSQRVSSTFRFDFASADLVLDARSEQDLENLIDLIKVRDIDSRRILLFGFADAIGAAPFNVGLSRSRADAVATRLRLPPRNVHGIGEDSPVACNLQSDGNRDEVGTRKNRRVEVWIES